jgi:hypothetical protein
VLFTESALKNLPPKRVEDLKNGYCTPLTLLEFSSMKFVEYSPGALGLLPL